MNNQQQLSFELKKKLPNVSIEDIFKYTFFATTPTVQQVNALKTINLSFYI